MAWTYFSPELTLNEMKLVEDKDEKYMLSFKLYINADVDETEMRLSSSSSKYLIAYCRRRTIAIPCQNLPVANRESDSAVTTSESLPSLEDSSGTSETPLLDQDEPYQEQPNQDVTVSGRARKMSVRHKLMLLFVILMLAIGVTVGLSIYLTKTKEKEAVLILSNFIRGSNQLVPMVIDLGAKSTGKFSILFLSGNNTFMYAPGLLQDNTSY